MCSLSTRARFGVSAVVFCSGLGVAPLSAAFAASGEGAVYQGNGDSIRCPSGIVRIAEIQAFVQNSRSQAESQIIGSASTEVCSDNETKYIDIVTHGAPDDSVNTGQLGQRSGVDGSVQVHGRTARLNANVYIPLNDADYTQCSRQDDNGQDGTCKPHGQVVSFTGNWVFSLGKWKTFRTGTDSAGNPV
ncbi:hypothetical protein, partial [Asaia prunellae]|uniref:hypothetical protein n=1 Tax=Asaia prunellae TaxID=610245 RepID=UPI0011DDE4B7